jgi:hypothetical protein
MVLGMVVLIDNEGTENCVILSPEELGSSRLASLAGE